MHGKEGAFSKIKGSIYNVPIEAANMSNFLTSPKVSNGLVAFNLK